MIKSLAVVFFFGFIYGCIVHQFVGAALSLAMVALMLYGERQLRKRDAEYLAMPCSAKSPPDTRDILAMLGVEGSADRL
jgi:hypothetical protein